MKITDAMYAAGLAGIKSALDGGFIYLFAGPVPAIEGDALDMGAAHTEIAKLSVGGDGTTGLTLQTPANGVMVKTPAEAWQGTTAFSGFQSAASSLTPTFLRFCPSGDNGRTALSTARLQMTAGGAGSGAEMRMRAAPYANGAPIDLAQFEVYGAE